MKTIKTALKALSYLILIFGFFYMAWHFGRLYEKEIQLEAQAELSKQEEKIEDTCRVYIEALNEVINPTDRLAYINKSKELKD